MNARAAAPLLIVVVLALAVPPSTAVGPNIQIDVSGISHLAPVGGAYQVVFHVHDETNSYPGVPLLLWLRTSPQAVVAHTGVDGRFVWDVPTNLVTRGAWNLHATILAGVAGTPVVSSPIWDFTAYLAPGEATSLAASPTPNAVAIHLSWAAPADDGGTTPQYNISRAAAGSQPVLVGQTASTSWDDPVPVGSTWSYTVQPFNAAGQGPASTITATAPSTAPTADGLTVAGVGARVCYQTPRGSCTFVGDGSGFTVPTASAFVSPAMTATLTNGGAPVWNAVLNVTPSASWTGGSVTMPPWQMPATSTSGVTADQDAGGFWVNGLVSGSCTLVTFSYAGTYPGLTGTGAGSVNVCRS